MTSTTSTQGRALALIALLTVTAGAVAAPQAHADNSRLNNSVFANIYTAQKQNGCVAEPRIDRRLVDAARAHALDVLNNRDLDGDLGSDGSTTEDRSRAAGFTGKVAETVAINSAIAISGIDILGQWYGDPVAWGIMRDCSHTAIGVWSENSLDRSVVVAVYGTPA
ncbi:MULTISPECIES: CAP domain-containing protein [unclassified Mycobacterium]|uniref:CAP domain-containing protein n=1 Tax=unclassified Mycobacterium TaxID=2642494 RepID=UPI0029C8797A|nr:MULTISPECIES: CAP domain-containing protein [unclassified Mycobacterium]